MAYLLHPLLAERLAQAVDAVFGGSVCSAREIFGSSDDLKFCSSMILFNEVVGATKGRFRLALQRFFAGEPNPRTLELPGGGID